MKKLTAKEKKLCDKSICLKNDLEIVSKYKSNIAILENKYADEREVIVAERVLKHLSGHTLNGAMERIYENSN